MHLRFATCRTGSFYGNCWKPEACTKKQHERRLENTATNWEVVYFLVSSFEMSLEVSILEKASNHFFVGTLIQEENAALNCFCKNSSNLERKGRLKFLQEQLNTSVESSDQRCYSGVANKLNNTEKRSMLMAFTEDFFLSNKKIPLILSLFYENCFITDFKENAEFFNSFFSKQYSLIANHSKLPTSLNYVTDQRLSTTTFLAKDISILTNAMVTIM